MRCNKCIFESNCSLREIASDLIGCEGHSQGKPQKVKETHRACIICGKVFEVLGSSKNTCSHECYRVKKNNQLKKFRSKNKD